MPTRITGSRLDDEPTLPKSTSRSSVFGLWLCVFILFFFLCLIGLLASSNSNFAVDSGATIFNETRAREYALDLISVGPHQAGSVANALVRAKLYQFCDSMSTSYGDIECKIQTQAAKQNEPTPKTETKWYGPIENVLMKFNNNGRKTVMLTAHYDSSAYSPGTSDDLLGVVSMMEWASAYSESLRNKTADVDVLLAFTNAEEAGLSGAAALVDDEWASEETVVFNINMDSGGGGGMPFLMGFSKFAFKTFDLWAGAGKDLAKGSPLASDLSRMSWTPGGTDFLGVLHNHYAGIDLLFVGKPRIYHTRYDNPSGIVDGTYRTTAELLNRMIQNIDISDFAVNETDPSATYLEIPFNLRAPFVFLTDTVVYVFVIAYALAVILMAIAYHMIATTDHKWLPLKALGIQVLFILISTVTNAIVVIFDPFYIFGGAFSMYLFLIIIGLFGAVVTILFTSGDVPLVLNIASHLLGLETFALPWIIALKLFEISLASFAVLFIFIFLANISLICGLLSFKKSHNLDDIDSMPLMTVAARIKSNRKKSHNGIGLVSFAFIIGGTGWIFTFGSQIIRLFDFMMTYMNSPAPPSFITMMIRQANLSALFFFTFLPVVVTVFAFVYYKHFKLHSFGLGCVLLLSLIVAGFVQTPFSVDHPAFVNGMILHRPYVDVHPIQLVEVNTDYLTQNVKFNLMEDATKLGLLLSDWDSPCGSPTYKFKFSKGNNVLCLQNSSLANVSNPTLTVLSANSSGQWKVNVSAPEAISFTLSIAETSHDGPTFYRKIMAGAEPYETFEFDLKNGTETLSAELFIIYDGLPWFLDLLPDWVSGKAGHSTTGPIAGYSVITAHQNGTVSYS